MNETATSPAPDSSRPTRTCVGCGERVGARAEEDLIRLILGPEGEIAVDARGGGFGRGAHVHARPECLRRAVERGLSRSAKARVHTLHSEAAGAAVPLSVGSLAAAIQHATARRIEGLLASAARSRHLVRGSDAVTSASQRGEAELIVVATDAAAAASLTAVRLALAEGRAVAWGSKEQLGAALLYKRSDAELAVLAITSRSLARSVRSAVRIADACGAVIAGGNPSIKGSPQAGKRQRSAVDAMSGNSQVQAGSQASPPPQAGSQASPRTRDACAQVPNGGKLGAPKGNVAPRGDEARRDRGIQFQRAPLSRAPSQRAPLSGARGPRRDRRSDG